MESIRNVFRACVKKAGILKKVTPHTRRHSGVYPEEFRGDALAGAGDGSAVYPAPVGAPQQQDHRDLNPHHEPRDRENKKSAGQS
jgi:integrase